MLGEMLKAVDIHVVDAGPGAKPQRHSRCSEPGAEESVLALREPTWEPSHLGERLSRHHHVAGSQGGGLSVRQQRVKGSERVSASLS